MPTHSAWRHHVLILCAVCIVALTTGASNAAAAPRTIFTTNGSTLYRATGNVIESFELSASITSMTVNASGEIWAAQANDPNGDGKAILYTIQDPFGTPTLLQRGEFLNPIPTALAFIGDQLYGMRFELYAIDPVAQTQTPVGLTGNMSRGIGGAGYDPVGDILYGTAGGGAEPAAIYEIDYSLSLGPEPTARFAAPINRIVSFKGSDFFNGELYLSTFEGDVFTVGTVDTVTGQYTEVIEISRGIRQLSVAVVVVPEPNASLCMAAILPALFCLQRRAALQLS